MYELRNICRYSARFVQVCFVELTESSVLTFVE